MRKLISFGLIFLVVASAQSTSSLPEMRMTPAEVLLAVVLVTAKLAAPRWLGYTRKFSSESLQRLDSIRFCFLSDPTPRSRHTHIGTTAWLPSSPASGTLGTAHDSIRSR